MKVITVLEYLLHELRTITTDNGNKLYREGYIQAIKDFLTAYED